MTVFVNTGLPEKRCRVAKFQEEDQIRTMYYFTLLSVPDIRISSHFWI